MNVLSLFDGISCGRLALDRAGIAYDKYYASEIEPSAIKIATKNFPDTIELGDARDFESWPIDWGNIGLVIGGSPCQSLSIVLSKTRENLDGKSRLFFTYVDILNKVKEANPNVLFLFENVASMNEESRDAISELLGCQPIFIDSALFSAQERPRLYWTNFHVAKPDVHSRAVLKDIMVDDVPEKYFYKEPVLNIDMSKQVCGYLQINIHDMHKRVFNPAFKCHTLTCVTGGNQQKKVLVSGRARKLIPLEYERMQTLPDGYTEGVCDGKRWTAVGNGWTVDVIAYILGFLPKEYKS